MSQQTPQKPVAIQLLSKVPDETKGQYNKKTHTWSHRDSASFSPVKHCREA